MRAIPRGRVPGARYWLWIAIAAGLVVGFLTIWWIGLLAGVGTILTPPVLYTVYLRLWKMPAE